MPTIKKKELKAIFNLIKARLLSKKIPLFVGWALTNRCNYRCEYCGRWGKDCEELTTEEILAVIGQLAAMGAYRINFTGGEPLIRQDLGLIVRGAKAKGLYVDVSTNGSLVPRMIGQIRDIDCLRISYDGPKDVHDRQRNEGSYYDVLEAVNAAKNSGLCTRLHTVLTSANLDHTAHVLEFARGHSITVDFAVVGLINYISEASMRRLLPETDRYKKALDFLIREKMNGNSCIGNSLDGLKYLRAWPDYKKISCCAGRIYCRIEPDGQVYPCGGIITSRSPINCSHPGFRDSFKKLTAAGCLACWCNTRIEMNNLYTFNLKAARDLLKTLQ